MLFYLGTHQPHWLALTSVPLFVSIRRLQDRRDFPKALGPWGQDSGGFTMLSDNGHWTFGPQTYVDNTRRIAERVGMPNLASIMDWMCEPPVRAKTGKTTKEHQALTIESFLTLRDLAPEIPWMPVIQGWAVPDYLDHIDQYTAAGIDLRQQPIVGVGSICRRQAKLQAARIINAIAAEGIRIHAFGVKTDGLKMFGAQIVSADSMAWSKVARGPRNPVLLAECAIEGRHKNCANCIRWALRWRADVVAACQAENRYPMQQLDLRLESCL